MASRRNSSSKKRGRGRGRATSSRCGSAGRSSRSKRTEKKHNKFHQRGCQNQSGGGSITGGWPWGASDVQHQTGGGSASAAGGEVVPHSINGNHYALNTATTAPPQASNAIVERYNMAQQTAGRRRRRSGHGHGRKGKKTSSKSRRIALQSGGMAEYLPELVNSAARTTVQVPSSIVHSLQGPATPFVSASPTSQPIGQPIALK